MTQSRFADQSEFQVLEGNGFFYSNTIHAHALSEFVIDFSLFRAGELST